jgi:hypothetical protein
VTGPRATESLVAFDSRLPEVCYTPATPPPRLCCA